jgi:signal transduction histidine kinase
MRIDLGRRLVPLSTLGVVGSFVTIVFAIALFAFGSFIAQLRHDSATLVAQSTQIAANLRSNATALAAARRIEAPFIVPSLLVTFIDRQSRVTVVRAADEPSGTRTTVIVRSVDDRRLPEAHGIFARLVLGLATTFGLGPMHAHAGHLDVTVDADQPRLVGTVGAFVPAFGLILIFAVAIAAVIARILARGALRPLTEVTRALERFSEGDFTAEIIEHDGNAQLGALATAYNGAVQQVERAFAERARANAIMRQFIADGGHQLRTPLTVIRGFVGILRSAGTTMPQTERDHILESMLAQTLVIGSLIDKLILLDEWEADEHAEITELDVVRLCRAIVKPLALAHPDRDIRLHAGTDAYASADAVQLTHAISNVLENALKYTAGPIDLDVSESNSRIRVVVADCGPGMHESERVRAFDRFFRGRQRDVGGSGLGLAIAKKGVERCRGSIQLESSVAAGTRITIDLAEACPPVA